MADGLGFTLEKKGRTWMLVNGNGARVATFAEVRLWLELAKVRRQLVTANCDPSFGEERDHG